MKEKKEIELITDDGFYRWRIATKKGKHITEVTTNGFESRLKGLKILMDNLPKDFFNK